MLMHIDTPLLNSGPLSEIAQKNVWLKMEALQPSGSFKIRGIGYACQTYLSKGARRFISSSGGNAGLAVAYAGKMLRVPVVVVVPETTSQRAIDLLRMEKAQVKVHGSSWQEANQFALSLLDDNDAFLHPFDDPLLWEGHASMIDEVVAAGVEPDVVVLSVGGGGLLCGAIKGLKRNGLSHVPVIAVETEGAGSFRAAVSAGKAVELEKISSVASSLGAKKVCDMAVNFRSNHHIISELVTDAEAVSACRLFADDHRILTEPACGASLSLIYERKPILDSFKNPLIIVCGGATMSMDNLISMSKQTP